MAPPIATDTLRRKEKVFAAIDMPGIPAGTKGRVTFVQGFDWIRYWVRFENGVTRGSLARRKLARPEEWDEIQARLARGEDPWAPEAPAAAQATSGDGDGGEGGGGEGIVHDGVLVPAHLLERSKRRREALAAG